MHIPFTLSCFTHIWIMGICGCSPLYIPTWTSFWSLVTYSILWLWCEKKTYKFHWTCRGWSPFAYTQTPQKPRYKYQTLCKVLEYFPWYSYSFESSTRWLSHSSCKASFQKPGLHNMCVQTGLCMGLSRAPPLSLPQTYSPNFSRNSYLSLYQLRNGPTLSP